MLMTLQVSDSIDANLGQLDEIIGKPAIRRKYLQTIKATVSSPSIGANDDRVKSRYAVLVQG